jgi:hypothetical protein
MYGFPGECYAKHAIGTRSLRSLRISTIGRPARLRTAAWRSLVRTWLILILAAAGVQAAYKILPWNPRAIESYPSRLASEGVTIAVEPLFTDALAARAFNRSDMVTRGIMPLAIIICNSNSFAVEVEGASIELILEEDPLRSLDPLQALQLIFEKKSGGVIPIQVPIPIPRIRITTSNAKACQDFKEKYFGERRRIEPHATAGGFLFMCVTPDREFAKNLAAGRVYVPRLFRGDTGANLLFFEIDLRAAMDAAIRK